MMSQYARIRTRNGIFHLTVPPVALNGSIHKNNMCYGPSANGILEADAVSFVWSTRNLLPWKVIRRCINIEVKLSVKFTEKKISYQSNTGLVLACLLVQDVILIRTGAGTLTDIGKMMKALALLVVMLTCRFLLPLVAFWSICSKA